MQFVRETLNSQTKLAFLVCLGMIGVIATVLAFEHIGGYIPCALCLEQRIPYYIGIPIAFVALLAISMKWPQILVCVALTICGLLVMWSLALAAYHSGVEWGWWSGPSECSATASSNGAVTSANSLLDQLSFSKPPSCDEAAGRFLGLSFAGWNVIVSAIIAFVAFRAAMLTKAKIN
ncbi:MAG: disulfide bond formation protein B [Hyphomicrobiales bacterium]|nr:disulfide bond formation protein B [Hyphomicrobiales bacterium]